MAMITRRSTIPPIAPPKAEVLPGAAVGVVTVVAIVGGVVDGVDGVAIIVGGEVSMYSD